MEYNKNNTIVPEILKLLEPKNERDKKQVALFLKPATIEKLDNATTELSKYSNRKITRNTLIEMAIDNLLDNIPIALSQYLVDYDESFVKNNEKVFDLILCCGDINSEKYIKDNHYWDYVRINEKNLDKIKYFAIYVGAPVSKIKYIAEVLKFEEYNIEGTKKYRIYLKNIEKLKHEIPLGNTNALQTRGVKYTTLEKVLNAKEYKDILT